MYQVANRVQLDADAKRTDRLTRLDERTSNVVIPHQSESKTQATLRRITDRSRNSRIRHRNDDVRIRGLLDRKPAAHLVSRLVDRLAVDQRIRTREIDVFEQAHRMSLRRQRM